MRVIWKGDQPLAIRKQRRSALAHSARFRQVSTRYPRRVAEAYEGDLVRAASDDDATVAVKVAEWERAHGLEPRDWVQLGRDEEGRSHDER